ncbi:phosphatidylserine/phosphatidylglycerophosphate/cardiolipin synthase family protein [Myxococcus sp. RHSTA-1-4]|uniref:phospholipase D-like domain-containing protein n=1 Tax=Myxococcus sp. RHSTA-1-4 TaxID=2874601 RepID=UPI001CBD1FAC|nr:phospholipase D-like domain-containing protein [Myxococcus sp. RHSTA-1-4]MBZ4414925.1 cardiolipin synthase B [Myxococcus sp. RHSTA-1-4]
MRDPEVVSEQSGVVGDRERGLARASGAVPEHGPVWSPQVSGLLLSRFYLPRGHAVVQGNACQLLRDGVEAYPAMLEAIRRARRYIRLETYMFITDAVGELFGEALAEAAERGVHVKVLYDAVGSWTSRRGFFESLRRRGVDIRAFKPFSLSRGLRHLLRRDHRKILVVDGEVAFTGGVNIAAHWAPEGRGAPWRDDVLRIEGPAVHELERRFLATWRMMFQDRFHRLATGLRHWKRRAPRRGQVGLAVLSSRRSIHRAYLHAIQRARSSVLIAAAYFIPDRRMVAALREAARRGVEVHLLLNARSDHPLLEFATRAFYEKLLGAGIRIFEWQRGVLHAKTAVVDGVWGTIGSFNLERLSLAFNHEVNAVFADPRLGRQLEDSFRADCGHCREVTLAGFRRRPLWQKGLERVLYACRKVL